MQHGLIHADGPCPRDPEDARTLGYEERKLGELLRASDGEVRMYCHATSVPELVSYVRAVGRDCVFRPFAETQAMLIVEASCTP
jgi:hypothetical protein